MNNISVTEKITPKEIFSYLDPRETFSWVAIYKSGMVAREVDGIRYKDLLRDEIAQFVLVNAKGHPKISVNVKDERKTLIFRKRRHDTTGGTRLFTIYIIGWHIKTESGRIEETALYLYPNGTVELSDFKDNIKLITSENA